MPVTITIGHATIIQLSDTEEAFPARDVYIEAGEFRLAAYKDLLTPDGGMLLNYGNYLVRAEGKTVLVDTGYGPSHNGRLMDEMRDAGVRPEEVDVVTFTHLHVDHVGWNLVYEGDRPGLRFPRARYLVPGGDWEYFGAQAEDQNQFLSQVRPLEDLGAMDLIGGDHVVSPAVTSVFTPGHTPGHLSFLVRSGGEQAFILGDVSLSPIDMQEVTWKTSFDEEPDLAVKTRIDVLNRLEEGSYLVAAGHFPKPGFGRFIRQGGRRTWQPIA